VVRGWQDPSVLFQTILHDGPIGAELNRFRYTVDVRSEQLLLAPVCRSWSGAGG
jgi:hypothetical protein